MTHYTATVTREGKWWMVRIPDLDGLTQARRLSDAELMAREWIAVTLNKPLSEITVTVTVDRVGGIDVATRLDAINREREHASALEREATAQAAELAKALSSEDVPLRDIGAVMGISFQRAHQLVKL